MDSSNLPILIIEDNHDDYESIVRIFSHLHVSNPIYRIVLGTDCLDYLQRKMSHQKRVDEPLPALILLDLHLPAINGFEILQEIKTNPLFRHIPVIVLSTSTNARDVRKCYELGANGYMVKDVDYDRYRDSMRSLSEFWLRYALLPEPSFIGP